MSIKTSQSAHPRQTTGQAATGLLSDHHRKLAICDASREQLALVEAASREP